MNSVPDKNDRLKQMIEDAPAGSMSNVRPDAGCPTCGARSSARNANAERYEWLRSHSWVDISLIKSVLNFGPGYQQTKPEILDAAIDAELARSDGSADK